MKSMGRTLQTRFGCGLVGPMANLGVVCMVHLKLYYSQLHSCASPLYRDFHYSTQFPLAYMNLHRHELFVDTTVFILIQIKLKLKTLINSSEFAFL